MGFLGFGMRKEVYKRKPKESFKKLKDIYGNDWTKIDHNPDAPKLTSEEILNKPRFKSIHDTNAYKYIKISIFLLLIAVFLNFILIQPWLSELKLNAFTQSLIENYSNDYKFLLNSGSRLHKLSFFHIDSTYNVSMILTKNVNSENFFEHNDKDVARIGTWNSNAYTIKFDNDVALIERWDSVQRLTDKWMVIYETDTMDSTYYEILKHIGVESQYIEDIRSRLKSTKTEELTYENHTTTIEISPANEFGYYKYIRTTKELRENENLIKVDSLTYLKIRRYDLDLLH